MSLENNKKNGLEKVLNSVHKKVYGPCWAFNGVSCRVRCHGWFDSVARQNDRHCEAGMTMFCWSQSECCHFCLATPVILPRNAIKSTVSTNTTTDTLKRSTWISCRSKHYDNLRIGVQSRGGFYLAWSGFPLPIISVIKISKNSSWIKKFQSQSVKLFLQFWWWTE